MLPAVPAPPLFWAFFRTLYILLCFAKVFSAKDQWLSTFSELKYMTFSSFPTLQEQQTAIESILDIDIRHQIERVDIRENSSLINIHLELFPAGLLSEEHNVWGKEGEKVLIIFHFCSFSKDSYFLCTWMETKLACSLLDIRKKWWLFLDRTIFIHIVKIPFFAQNLLESNWKNHWVWILTQFSWGKWNFQNVK